MTTVGEAPIYPSLGREPVGINHWSVTRGRTYGYLPTRMASPPFDRCQIILFCDRGTCVRTANSLPKVDGLQK